MKASAPPQRAAFLDGLRGIAALLVVVTHCTAALFPDVIFGTSNDDLAHVLYATPFLDLPFQGNFMVCIFYALSGLALSYHTLSRSDRSRAVSGLVRRYPRLMIPTLTGMLVAFTLMIGNLLPVQEASLISGSRWWGSTDSSYRTSVTRSTRAPSASSRPVPPPTTAPSGRCTARSSARSWCSRCSSWRRADGCAGSRMPSSWC